ncbi:MAG: hypothetical protein ACI93S_000156 [Ancylomarina sp.]
MITLEGSELPRGGGGGGGGGARCMTMPIRRKSGKFVNPRIYDKRKPCKLHICKALILY